MWTEPKKVTDLDLAFAGDVIDQGLLPAWEDVPEEFKENSSWPALVSGFFYDGGKWPKTKEGVDSEKAKRHIVACLRSFQPKHEHKIAGVAWLMSQWFEEPARPSTLRRQ